MPNRFTGEPSWVRAGFVGRAYGGCYFAMFGGVIGAVARDWGEVAEA